MLYYSLIGKDISDIVPLTFHIKNGKQDFEYENFVKAYKKYEDHQNDTEKNLWIIKPGENTNRGNGIFIAESISEIDKAISNVNHTYIIQKYIERPLLFQKRKFDIRCFALVTSVNGFIKGYYYQEGYLRTSSQDYSVNVLSKSVHLTNEAVQIMYDNFGKHEAGNKISYNEFQKYLENTINRNKSIPKINFFKDILPKIKVRFRMTYRK